MNIKAAKDKILKKLDSLSSYDEMYDYLENTTVGSKQIPLSSVIADIPEFKKELDMKMVQQIASEQGNPEVPGFTISKDYTNERILELIDLNRRSDMQIGQLLGFGKEGKDRLEYLKSMSDKKDQDLIPILEKQDNLRRLIAAQRRDFDRDAQHTILSMAFPSIQVAAGWTDLFKKEGTEAIESRMLKSNPKYKHIGIPESMKETKRKLQAAYDEEQALRDSYDALEEEWGQYVGYMEDKQSFENMLNTTGYDEILNHISLEQLTNMLEGK